MSYVKLTVITGSGSAQAPVAERPIALPLYGNKERPVMARTKLRDLDAHNPDFHERMLAWAFQAQCEIHELVLTTKETIAATKAMIADVDRMLVRG